MLIIGTVSTDEEQIELKYVAQMFLLAERIKYLAQKPHNEKLKKNK